MARPGRDRRPDDGPVFLGILVTDHPPAAPVKLVSAAGTESALDDAKAWFRPLHPLPGMPAQIGEFFPPGDLDGLECTAHQVQRGRRGSKAPEPFFILSRSTGEFTSEAHVRVRGLLKAITRAVAALAQGDTPGAPEWWLALELARRGSVRHGKVVTACGEEFALRLEHIPELKRAGNLVVWDEHTQRSLDELEKLLNGPAANPLSEWLAPPAVTELLGLASRSLANHLVSELAQRHGLETRDGFRGCEARLAGAVGQPELDPGDARVRDAIFAALAAEKVSGRRDLLAIDKSRPHVQAWMFGAGILVEGPDGYIFTVEQLQEWHDRLNAAGITPADAGVRDIKDHLGLARRAAEAYRAWLVEQSG